MLTKYYRLVVSSPLARGLRLVDHPRRRRGGIIPARAGFTCFSSCAGAAGGDHPRSRGVYGDDGRDDRPLQGSSPLARGLRVPLGQEQVADGIIPARAGFTIACFGTPKLSPDHPRSCGVYTTRPRSEPQPGGSSPLVRGLLFPGRPRLAARGIIPARAGFTCPSDCAENTRQDHPRSCGVYPLHPLGGGDPPGSSPLVRGLLGPADRGPGRRRIIPARAGFTTSEGEEFVGRADHPRSCGVYLKTKPAKVPAIGSSPLVRGLHEIEIIRGRIARIIPARAGFTLVVVPPGQRLWDHPRSCGVYYPSHWISMR